LKDKIYKISKKKSTEKKNWIIKFTKSHNAQSTKLEEEKSEIDMNSKYVEKRKLIRRHSTLREA